MRIIGGNAKNKKIMSQKGQMVRPTLARIKESLFEIIKPYIEDSIFLDLFSGTGSIALEALSRGAKRAVMIEKNNEALRIIIQNVESMNFSDKCRAYKNDAQRAIEILAKKNESFDIIFLDPPYKEELCTIVIEKISKEKILKNGGIIIAEHHISEKLADKIDEFNKIDERVYSGKVMTFYSY